ncbi:MAG: agmatinase [Anaerolineae bacterium]|nr:agmatinase [Anaerolineae bacterium]MDW8101323.1 agmatinase [Anaerolineae bacterium]
MRFLAANFPPEEADIVIVGVTLEATETWRKGPALAPDFIRYASESLESFSAIFGLDLTQLKLGDAGNLDHPGGLEEALLSVEKSLTQYFRKGKKVLIFGGEHTVTLPAVKAALSVFGKVQLLVLDAHSDLRDEYLGLKVSHATVTRRCSEVASKVVLVGARSFYGGEFDFINKAQVFLASPENFASFLEPSLPLYLSLDLDALDPSQCPGVTNPEPGGLSYGDVIEIFRKLRKKFNVVAMDIVELAPPYDPSFVSAVCAAKLAIEGIIALWGYISPHAP